MSATRSGGKLALAATLTGLIAAPLAVVTTAVPAHAATATIQILGTNDFHGRLVGEGTTATSVAGAAQFAGAIEQYRADATVDGTIFAAAGDLVGASTFDSFIQQDKPTIDAMNAMGLAVSAAGNHEFDAGYNDLANRIMKPYDATTNPTGGANWQYLAANVRKKSDNSYALPDVAASPGTSDGGTWMTTVAGINVGFVGAVTEDLPALVTPAGIADVKVTSIVDEVKAGAAALKSNGADVVVMLVHEGAADTACVGTSDDSAFGKIVKGVGTNVNAIISGHTHQAYDCNVGGVPVVSAGQYGTNFNALKMTVNSDTDTVTINSHAIVSANTVALTAQAAIDKKAQVKTIVDAAVAQGDVLGAKVLGKLGGTFNRAKLADGTTENRGGESTLGNLVAEVQRWATSTPEAGAAQIAFMNPGGLRTDMGGTNGILSYKQAAVVQPFANTLVNMKLTGAQIKTVLEQQWQRDGAGNVPSRPFLRLGVSEGFFSTYDPTKAEGNRVTSMSLNGKAIDPAASYSVTVNSFLASGGDNFRAFNGGTAKRDTGKVDLQAMVDYMAAKAATTPLAGQQGPAPGRRHPAGQRTALLPPRPGDQAQPLLARHEHGGRREGRHAGGQGRRCRRRLGGRRQHRGHRAERRVRQECGHRRAQGQGPQGQADADLHRTHDRHDVLAADRRAQGQARAQGSRQAGPRRQGQDPGADQGEGLRTRHQGRVRQGGREGRRQEVHRQAEEGQGDHPPRPLHQDRHQAGQGEVRRKRQGPHQGDDRQDQGQAPLIT